MSVCYEERAPFYHILCLGSLLEYKSNMMIIRYLTPSLSAPEQYPRCDNLDVVWKQKSGLPQDSLSPSHVLSQTRLLRKTVWSRVQCVPEEALSSGQEQRQEAVETTRQTPSVCVDGSRGPCQGDPTQTS